MLYMRARVCAEGKIGTAFFNIRLAPQDVNDTLSGYTHNAGECGHAHTHARTHAHAHTGPETQSDAHPHTRPTHARASGRARLDVCTAVSPIGMAAQLPIIMSHKITELDPDFFFVGGGEVDLKLGFTAKEFVAKYKPYVTDITF